MINDRRINRITTVLAHGKEYWYIYLIFLSILGGLVSLVHSMDRLRDIPIMQVRLVKLEDDTKELKSMTKNFKESIDRFNTLFDIFIKKGIDNR